MEAFSEEDDVGGSSPSLANLIKEGEGGAGQGCCYCCARCGLCVLARQGVGDRVEAPRSILHVEVEVEKLADPLVLGHRREALVKQILEAEVVGADDEVAAPQVRSPVPNHLDHTYELALICRELKVTGSEWLAEECQESGTLVKDRAEPRP
jgi:hypothetical protein